MPRRRPPGAGPGLSATLLAIFLVLPWLSTAAQQQQPSENARRASSPSSRGHARVDTILPDRHRKPDQASIRNASKRDPYTPILAQNERAVATTVSSAPANSAVRAPPARNAASGGLTRPSARSLQDWEVEDFVLLATVDGHLHARDRYNGGEIWELDLGTPMLETTYHYPNNSEGDNNPPDLSFMWIVEPKEDGRLYILNPGPYPHLQDLGMTIKQLAEELSPYASTDSIVYTAEKRNIMLVVDARTGTVKKTFSSGGSTVIDTESCEPQATGYFNAKERECKGYFNIGRTEYTVNIHNARTTEDMCTIKYFEWTPNNRDRDLQAQYLATMDNQYIYSRFDGHALAYDHNRPKRLLKRPVFERKFSAPVVRVFDVARPYDDEENEPALVLLPQPPGPPLSEEKGKNVWLNTTEAGSWYALSEQSYPAVTDRAPEAPCYSDEWSSQLLRFDGQYTFPERVGLVGVHSLDRKMSARSEFPAIGTPTEYPEPVTPEVPAIHSPKAQPAQPNEPQPQPQTAWSPYYFAVLCIVLASFWSVNVWQPERVAFVKKRLSKLVKTEKLDTARPATPISIPQDLPIKEQETVAPLAVESAEPETLNRPPTPAPVLPAASSEDPTLDQLSEPDAKERKVKFDIPDDEESEFEQLSRTTTAELTPEFANTETNGTASSPADASQTGANGETGVPEGQAPASGTPGKKKKTHRGKRGGQRKPKKPKDEQKDDAKGELKDDDEVDRIVDAAKQLDRSPTLHPDEITVNGDGVEDVSNIKKIGKLTIDFDRLLGNGSGGTFVFEGKWNERDVAVKRMLPQYFGLAEQEVKLLQESDLHPNVIRYFDDEKDENFLYIAVELCQASLADLYRDGRPGEDLTETQQRLVNDINCDMPRALYQLALGVNHLHSLRIIHRDIKPQNILIAYPQRNQKNGPRLVISDFGLCKTLPDNVSTLIGTTGNAGTVGWKAPELITQPKDIERGSSTGYSRDSSSSTDPVAQGVKRAVDIFSLGCVFFYILTNGSHPFDDDEGWMQIRELNIKKNKPNFKQLRLGDDYEEPIRLISWMLSNRPEDRPTAIQVMNHPFFWSAEKRLNFLCDCSDHWEREPRDPPSEHLSILETAVDQVLDKKRNFLAKLDHAFIASLGKQRKYTGDRMLDLLRALRNKKNHYEDMDESVKAKVGPLPHGYLRYWTTKFPKLIMACYDCVVECGLQGEPRFRPYFENQTGL